MTLLPSPALHVALVVDSEIVHAGLTAFLGLLTDAFLVTGAAARPDIVLVDAITAAGQRVQQHRRARPQPCIVGVRAQPVTDVVLPASRQPHEWVPIDVSPELLQDRLRAAYAEHRRVTLTAASIPRLDTPVRLTDREHEVLQLICASRTNQEMADELFLSVNSIKSHVRSLYAKTGARTRAQAVAIGLSWGY